jgi:RNA polymerase sigma-70 factor (ECF subfamily)
VDARDLAKHLAAERPRMLRFARSRVPTQADAEDVVQRTMLRAAEGSGSIDDPGRWRAWLASILRRAIADYHRSKPRELPRDMETLEAAPNDEAPAGRPCTCGVRLLATLRPPYSDVLRRVDLEGQAPEAAARDLAISPVNLHVRLHRARRALREKVARTCGVTSLAPCLDCICDAHGRCGAG